MIIIWLLCICKIIVYTVFAMCPIFLVIHLLEYGVYVFIKEYGVYVWILKDSLESYIRGTISELTNVLLPWISLCADLILSSPTLLAFSCKICLLLKFRVIMLNIWNYQLYECTKLKEALLIKNKNKNKIEKGKRNNEVERGTYPFLIILKLLDSYCTCSYTFAFCIIWI